MLASLIKVAQKGSFSRSPRFHTLSLQGLKNTTGSVKLSNSNSTDQTKVDDGAGPISNKTKVLADQLGHTFTRDKLKRVIVGAASGEKLDGPTSQQLFTSTLQHADIKDLKELRSLLATAQYSAAVELDKESLNKVIFRCVSLGNPDEGLQWLLLAEEAGQLTLSSAASANLLNTAANTYKRSWDALNWLLQSLSERGLPLPIEVAALAFKEAEASPAMRWRLVSRFLESGASLPAEMLARGFRCLVDANQAASAAHIYTTRLADAAMECEDAAIFAPQLALPMSLVAAKLGNFELLQQVLLSSAKGLMCSKEKLDVAVDASTRTEELEAAWLGAHVAQMANTHSEAPLHMGPTVGSAISWLIFRGQTGAAVSIWNDFVLRVQKCAKASLIDESSRAQVALEDALNALTGLATARSIDLAVRTRSASLIKTILLPTEEEAAQGGGEAAVWAGVRSMLGPIRSPVLAESLVAVFTDAWDMTALSAVLARSLAQGHLVSDSTITGALEVFQMHGDHELALDLFSMYLSITNPQRVQQQESKVQGRTVSLKGKVRFTATKKIIRSVLAPRLFGVAMTSFAEKGDLDAMMAILTNEVPSRGFIPRMGCFQVALEALQRSGKYSEATALFAQSQALYKKLSDDSAASTRSVPVGYGVYSLSLVDVALRCCAKGRLGVTALDIFNGWEGALRKGQVAATPNDLAIFVDQVAIALAHPNYMKFLPRFLRSLSELSLGASIPRRTLVVALGAAVSFQDAETATVLVTMLEEAHGCALERVISRRDLLLEMERALGELDEAAAHAFIDECDALHGLALTASE